LENVAILKKEWILFVHTDGHWWAAYTDLDRTGGGQTFVINIPLEAPSGVLSPEGVEFLNAFKLVTSYDSQLNAMGGCSIVF
jgi:hypothetical protein